MVGQSGYDVGATKRNRRHETRGVLNDAIGQSLLSDQRFLG
jgi:hypothetical protein